MLITSKFTDYYDEAINATIDSDILYHRIQNNIRLEYDHYLYKKIDSILHPDNNLIYRFKDSKAIIRPFYIGFCGKIYQGYTYIPNIRNSNENIYGFEKSSFPLEILKMPFNKRFSIKNDSAYNFEELLDSKIIVKNEESIFNERKLVSFFFEDSSLKTLFIENPKLADFGFEHIFDSEDAAREIESFISNNLEQKENDIVRVYNNELKKPLKSILC